MWHHRVILILAVSAALCPATGFARTWRVEQDGSGDFAVIHNAMIACADGDTILIGPGRYDDFHPMTAPGWTRQVIAIVTKDDLTFIGAGVAETIIGPEVQYEPSGQLPPMAAATVEGVDARFENIGFENAYNEIYWAGPGGRLVVENCRFQDYSNGLVLLNPGGTLVKDSTFYSDVSQSAGVVSHSPSGPVDVAGCEFQGPNINERAINFDSTQNAIVRDCDFDLGAGVVYFFSSGSLTNCTSTERVGMAVWITDGSVVTLAGNQLHGEYSSLYVSAWSTVTGTDNIFSGGTDLATIYITSQSEVTLTGNHIFKSGEYAARIGQYHYEIQTVDLTGNYWDTTDPDLVATWIWDYDDDPVTRAHIEYLPMANGPVSVETRSWGDVKALFR